MAPTLHDYFHKLGQKSVEASLRKMAGAPSRSVIQDVYYRQNVIEPAWFNLPLPIRMVGRQKLRWDEFCMALREEVFDLNGPTVVLRPDMSARVAGLAKRFYGLTPATPEAKAAPAAPASSAPAPPPPLATPVAPVKPAPSGQAPARDVAVGIDLGTTYSLVACVDGTGRACSIPNAAGDLLTPSVVLFDEGGTVVGKEAVLASAMEPEKVADCVKRDMGAKVYRKKINGEYLPPELISSLVLRSLKADAGRKLGPVHRAVVTVPAYFEETRRRATMDAGRLAGLDVLDIINEPTAAAIAYGYQLGFLDRTCKLTGDRPLRVLVFDLGGGTFDVTIVEIQGNQFKALATDGDVGLGGKDWDEKLIDLAAERFRHQFREDPRENPVSLQELALAAEAAKRTLTERPKATVFVNHLGSRLKVEVTRAEFEEATAALVQRTRLTTELVVRQAGLTWADIDRVLPVGGSTRMPMIGRMLQELAGKPLDHSLAVDEAVAHGAALYANLLAAQPGRAMASAPFAVTNVNSHSLGILGSDSRTGRKLNKILVPKDTPLPRTVTKVFRTLKPNQRSVAIKVLQGESDRPEFCQQVGICAIRGLPPHLPAGWPVQVTYTYETNGRLHVAARLKDHPAAVTTDFLRENRMPDEDLELWSRYVEEEALARV